MQLLLILVLFVVFILLSGLLWFARPPDIQWLIGSIVLFVAYSGFMWLLVRGSGPLS
jgi:hypothetical protein